MTPVEVKQWLKRGIGVNAEIEQLKAAKERAEYRASSTNAGIREKMSTGKKSRNDAALAAFADYSSRIDNKITELQQIINETHYAINSVDNSTLRMLLINRYILFMPWYEVATKMNYSTDHVQCNLHRKAIDAVSEFIPQ